MEDVTLPELFEPWGKGFLPYVPLKKCALTVCSHPERSVLGEPHKTCLHATLSERGQDDAVICLLVYFAPSVRI